MTNIIKAMSTTTLGRRALTTAVALLFMTAPLVLLSPSTEAQVFTWSTDQEVYTDIIISTSDELVIEAGVHVRIDPDINITVYGNITVKGTPTDPVWFEWNQTGQDWGAINIFDAREQSHFYNTHIWNAHEGIYAYNSDVYLKNCNVSFNSMNGTHVTNGKATILSTSYFSNGLNPDFTDSAIYLNNATGSIEGNSIFGNNNGVYMKEGSDVHVKSNYINGATSPTGFGIGMRSGTTSLVEENTVWNNFVGIICNASDASVKNNTIEKNVDDGVLLTDQDDSTVHFNTVRENGDDGIDINQDSTSFVLNNFVYENDDKGILVYGARPTIFMNVIHNNSEGLRIDAGGNVTASFANTIRHNTVAGVSVVGANSYVGSMVDYIHNNTGLGIYLEDSLSCFYATFVHDHGIQVRARGARSMFGNGTMEGTQNLSFDFEGSNITLLNYTRDSILMKHDGATNNLTTMWYLGVKVVNGNGDPFPGVDVAAIPAWGLINESKTNAKGEANWIALVESYLLCNSTDTLEHFLTPHIINVSYGGYFNTTSITMDTNRNITITLDVPNSPPVLNVTIPDLQFPEDTDAFALVNLSQYFEDEGPLNYTIDHEEDPSTVDGEINGTFMDFSTPTENWFGTRGFRVRAVDDGGLSTLSNNFSVEVTPVNDPPILDPVSDTTIEVNELLSFQLHANDVDNVLGEFTFKSDDMFIPEITVTLDPVQGFVTFRSTVQGVYQLHFYVCDPGPLCSENIAVNILVTGLNSPPFFTTTPFRTTYVNASYLYNIGIRDPDGDPTVLEMLFGPPGMELNDTNLTWTPLRQHEGDHLVSLRVTDGFNLPVYQNFTLTVLPRNHAPEADILFPMDMEIFDEGENVSFSGRAFDLDGDALNYSWRINGKLYSNDLGFSTTLSPGKYDVAFQVSDGSLTAYYNITITVKAKVKPPGPSVPHKTSAGGDEWCLWLPLVVVLMVVVVVIVVNQFGPHQRDNR